MDGLTVLTLALTVGGAACAVILPLLILGGLAFFLYRRSQQSAAYKQKTQSWSTTDGMVLMSSVQVRRTGKSRSTYPVVVYQYTVGSITYQGQRIRAGEQFYRTSIFGQAEQTAARYPVGARVTIYYNPQNPSESCLER